MFVNRVSELELLEKRYESNRAEMFVLYGRRRVGKTELLAQFCKGKRHVFFVADQVPEQTLRANFSRAINDALFGEARVNAVYNTWDDLFTALASQAQSERLIVVMDEFPYAALAHPPLASILQRLWDRVLKDGKIMLILNGSFIGMMEETVLGYQSPLYGRRTAQYLLEPLDFFAAQLFLPSFDADDRLRAYAVYGGTPPYLQVVDSSRPLEENIRETVLKRGAFLYDEARFILQQELREPRNYFAVLQAIAAGNSRQNEIKQASGVENIAPYLETLQHLHLVERAVPVTESQPQKSRLGLYRLKDNFIRFWFRFALPNRSQLERGAMDAVYDSSIRPELDAFASTVFEQVCRQYFWKLGLDGKLPFQPRQIGGWWKAGSEIDVVILGESQTMLAECKWSRNPVGVDIFEQLVKKSKGFPQPISHFGLCSRSGFTPQMTALAENREDILLFNWKDMAGG